MHGGDDFLTPWTTPRSTWFGGWLASWSAKTAVSRSSRRIPSPAIALRWRMMLPSVSRQIPLLLDRPATSSASTRAVIASSSREPHAWIEERVRHVDDQVDEQVDDRDHEHEPLDRREVAAGDGFG